jgi:outer membrane protein OmpA-like peptidoglycan-associated protein
LIPLVLLSWVTVQVERGRIEQDLTERAGTALAAIGAQWAAISFNGRDAELRGRAIQDNQPPAAEEAVRKVWGIREVDNKASLPPKVEPFLWSARRRGNRIRLVGYVPNRATRQTIIGMTNAALPGLEVVDRMTIARGVPTVDTWLAGLSFGLKQLASLKQGTVRFEDLALTITGEAEDSAGYKSVGTALKTGLPKGITLASAQITAPTVSPFVWSAQFAGGQLVLTGHVAGEAAKAGVLAAVPAGIGVVDRMEPAEGAPQGWAGAAALTVKELVRLQNGAAEMKDAVLNVSGLASDEGLAQAIRAALRSGLPSNFKLNSSLKAPEPPPPPPKAELPPPEPIKGADAPTKQPQPDPTAAPPKAEAPQPAPAPVPPPVKQADVTPPPAPAVKQAEPAPPPAPKIELTPPPPAAPAKQAEPAPPAAPKVDPTPPSPPPAPKVAEPAPAPPSAAKQPDPPPAAPTPAPEPAPKVAIAPPPSPPPPPTPANLAVCQENLTKIASADPILFDRGSSVLSSASTGVLDRLASAVKECPEARITIQGHADIEGTIAHNQRLSLRRAKAVADYLVKAGAGAAQLETEGYGARRPVAPNDTATNRARNRRIEFIVRGK